MRRPSTSRSRGNPCMSFRATGRLTILYLQLRLLWRHLCAKPRVRAVRRFRLEYLFVNGADVPFGADGFPEAPGSNAVFGRITADKLKPYADYSIVGIAFIVASDLGSVPSIIAMERRTDG